MTDIETPTRTDGTSQFPSRSSFFGRMLKEDRGDVPGWVLITLMTAGLTVVIWGLAGPALSRVFEDAISRVSGM